MSNTTTPTTTPAPTTNGSSTKPVSPRDLINLKVYLVNGQHRVHRNNCKDLRKAEYRAMAAEAWGTSSQTQYDVIAACGEDLIAEHTPTFKSDVEGVFWYRQDVVFEPCTAELLPLEMDERVISAKPRRGRKAQPKPKPVTSTAGTAKVASAERMAAALEAAVTAETNSDGHTQVVGVGVEAAPEPKAQKRTAKQDLARRVAQAIAEAIQSSQLEGSAALAGFESLAELQATAVAWVHHLPTGTDEAGKRWWPASAPRPDRSDWR
jgi:hypothetical protein